LVLGIHDLEVGYRGRSVLHGVNVGINSGELVSMLGRNGAGKSTLLKTVMGSVPLRAGRITLRNQDISSWRVARRVEGGIGFSPEGRRVFSTLSVRANLMVGAAKANRRQQAEGLERAVALFPELGRRMTQRAGTMSGGEQQMLAIARAFMTGPQLLLVEEPSHGLAPVVVDRVYEALRATAVDGTAVLVAEQFQRVRRDFSDRILVIEDGQLREEALLSLASPAVTRREAP
jgi:ABC-type branched-subunit amino acid transport system ATPase component